MVSFQRSGLNGDKMKRAICLAALLLTLFSTNCLCLDFSSANDRVDELIEHFYREANIPGISVAISKDNNLVYANSFGYSNIEMKSPTTNETKFRIGSVTKPITAVATVKLIEIGVIKPDTTICGYLNDLPGAYCDMTVAELAGHLAGIRHYTKQEIYSTNTHRYANLKDALVKFVGDSLLFAPGDSCKYSSYGYVLLGAVLEAATKKHFNGIAAEYLMQPAGIHDIVPDEMGVSIDNLSTFYYPPKDTGQFTVAQPEDYSYKWPAGGYLATASDLALFGSALLSGKIVDTSYLPLLFTPQKTTSGAEIQYGFGFRIGTDWVGRKVAHHGGESEGARAFFLIYPAQQLTIALLANVFRAPLFESEAETIAGYFLNDYSWREELIPTGHYEYEARNGDNLMVGSVYIEKNSGLIHDWNNRTVQIIDIVIDNDKIRLIGAARNGIVNIWLNSEREGYSGLWGYDKPQYDFKMSLGETGENR